MAMARCCRGADAQAQHCGKRTMATVAVRCHSAGRLPSGWHSQRRSLVVRVASEATPAQQEPTRSGRLISKTEVPAFIQRDDMMDQLHTWAKIEAAEGGLRNFGMPMSVDTRFLGGNLWGFEVGISKEGQHKTSLGINFDVENVERPEYIGRGADGMPTREGRMSEVLGKHLEIWKLDEQPVDEDLRATIRAFCVGLSDACNKYYAFGSVFSEEV